MNVWFASLDQGKGQLGDMFFYGIVSGLCLAFIAEAIDGWRKP